jgi:tetratricopeptide (TPR) repeat protein
MRRSAFLATIVATVLGTLTLGLAPVVASAASAHLDPGLHSLIAGDYSRAEQQLRLAVAEQPRNGLAHFSLASALRALDRNDEAIEEYRAAFNLGPNDKVRTDSLYGIALARDVMGDPLLTQQAWRDYIAYAERRPGNQAALRTAEERLDISMRLAAQPAPVPGVKKAKR